MVIIKIIFLTPEERIEIVKKALFFDLKMDKKKIYIVSFKSLTTLIFVKNINQI